MKMMCVCVSILNVAQFIITFSKERIFEISCFWCFIEPCIWNLSTQWKNSNENKPVAFSILANHMLYHQHTNTWTHIRTHTSTSLGNWKIVRHIFTTTMRNRCDFLLHNSVVDFTSNRMSACIFHCIRCQNISPPKHIRMFALRAYALPNGLWLHAFWFGHYYYYCYYLYLCISCDASKFATIFPYTPSLSLFTAGIPRWFPVAWYIHPSDYVCVQNSLLWWKTSRLVQQKKI